MQPTPDGGMVIMVRDNEVSDWRPLLGCLRGCGNNWPRGFHQGRQGHVHPDLVGSNTGRLVKIDIATETVEEIAEDPTFDIAGVIMNPDTRDIEGVMVYRDRLEYNIFDDSIRDDCRCAPAGRILAIGDQRTRS